MRIDEKILSLVIFFSSVLFISNTIAQDLIVGIEGDSLNCLIVKETIDKVFFSAKKNGSYKRMNLPKNQIKSITKSFYKTFDELEFKADETINKEPYTRIRLSVDYGRSKFFNQIEFSEFKFLNSLKNTIKGNSIIFSGAYFFKRKIGLGLDAFYFKPSQKAIVFSGSPLSYKSYDRNSVYFVGASFIFKRYFEVSELQSLSSVSLGLAKLNRKSENEYTSGILISQSFDQPVLKNLFFGIGGKLYFDLYEESMLQLTFGIKYNFLEN